MGAFTTVTGQVIDPQGRPYTNASLVCVFIPAPTATLAPTLGYNGTFPTVVAQADCDAAGRFTRILANNTLITDGHAAGQLGSQWCFRFYTALGYVPQISFSWCGVISGTTIDISAQLASVAPIIIPPCGGGGGGGVPPTVPAITGLNPISGPAGTVVTISGSGFGLAGVVTFNGIPATISSWSATSIVATVPASATTGNVVVTVGGMTSNGMQFTVTGAGPQITVLTPNSGAVGTTVVISGLNFGTTQGSSTVTLNGVPI